VNSDFQIVRIFFQATLPCFLRHVQNLGYDWPAVWNRRAMFAVLAVSNSARVMTVLHLSPLGLGSTLDRDQGWWAAGSLQPLRGPRPSSPRPLLRGGA